MSKRSFESDKDAYGHFGEDDCPLRKRKREESTSISDKTKQQQVQQVKSNSNTPRPDLHCDYIYYHVVI